MGALDVIAVGAAEHIERSFGPYAGLRAFAALLPRGPLVSGEDGALAARATLGALRCAAETRDTGALESAARAWAFCAGPPRFAEVVALVARLEREGARELAVLLARSEATRAPGPRASYLLGRTAEGAEQLDVALAAHREAARAPDGGDAGAAARARLAALLASRADPASRHELAGLVEGPTDERAPSSPEEKRLFATLGLASSSKFARAAALSSLEELARGALDPDPEARARARAAIRTAAAHVDLRGARLTALEADRVGACLKHWPAKEARERAAALLAGVVRLSLAKGPDRERALVELGMRDEATAPGAEQAQALLSGARFVAEGDESPHALGIRAVAALDRERPDLAAEALTLARARAPSPSPALWTGALLGLAHAGVARAALPVARALMEAEITPPRGWVSLAAALSGSPLEEARALSTEALERAGAAGEAAVASALSARWVRAAWAHAAAGRRAEALALLRKAAP